MTGTADDLVREMRDKREVVRGLLARDRPTTTRAVRDLWKAHSLAEDARDIAGVNGHSYRRLCI